jgi:hypothetical protein
MRYAQVEVTVSNYIDGTGLDPNVYGLVPLSTRGILAMSDVSKNAVLDLTAGDNVASGGTPMLFVLGGFGA